ncbi:MAG: sugar ABC transporter ATP-binding protein [Acidimicrobiales bacterium]
MVDLAKSFGGVRALDGVSLAVAPGEIHGLIGRNGSGKSTLIKILSGYHVPDPGGTLEVAGRVVPLPLVPGQAATLGLSFVHQDLGLIPTLSVLENLRAGRYETGPGRPIRWRDERRRVTAMLGRLGVRTTPDTLVGTLSAVDRALVAVVRAITDADRQEGGVLVLDEPTSYLPRDGVERLFSAMRRATGTGLGVVFVSHRLEEVMAVTDKVSVLRDGRLVNTLATPDVDEATLIQLILGQRMEESYPSLPTVKGDVGLAVTGLQGLHVHDLSLEVRRGEVLGLAGLIGMGQEEVAYLLFGAAPARAGTLRIGDSTIPAPQMTPGRAIRAGMALLPADRLGASGIGGLSVRDNVSLPVLGSFYRGGRLRSERETSHVAGLLKALDVRPPLPGRRLDSLSGGNQQKALLGKWLQYAPPVVLLDEPSQGVDVGARKEIFTRVRQLAADGKCVIMASTDAADLAHVCDRVLVFRYGRVVGELGGGLLTEARLVEQCYASGTLARPA